MADGRRSSRSHSHLRPAAYERNTLYSYEKLTRSLPFPSGDTIPRQQSVIAGFRQKLISTPDFFKKVYKYTFKLALTPGQRSLPLDTAIDYWRLLLSPPSSAWSSPQIPWLDWWITYLEERWRKGVNKDMWEQTAVFMTKSLEDPTMSWWSEDGAWPGVLDDFVIFVKERREGTSMDIE